MRAKHFLSVLLACDALNVPADTIARMNEQCEKINLLLGILNAGQDASALFPMAKEAALTMLDILSKTPPFSYMNIPKHRERIEKVFTADNALKYVEFAIKAATNSLHLKKSELCRCNDAPTLYCCFRASGILPWGIPNRNA